MPAASGTLGLVRGLWPSVIAICGCGRVGFTELASDTTGLSLVPPAATINVGSRLDLVATGGTPPYLLSLEGAGSLDGWTFVAPSRAGVSRIEVSDAEGATATAQIVYRGDRLFVIGGFLGAAPTDTVLTSSDGVTWTAAGQLPVARGNGAAVVFDDQILYLGGLNSGDAATDDVFASTDGATWTAIGTLPTPLTGFTATVHAGEIWIVGGFTGASNSGDAYHSRDGITWIPAASSLAIGRHELDVISRGDRLYVLGGHSDTAFLGDIQWTTDGAQWTSSPQQLTFAADFPAAGELGDRVFRTCGTGCMETETSLDLETWTPAAPLPDGERESPALVGFAGRMLLIGGGSSVLATDDGSSWDIIGALPAARGRTTAVQLTPR